MTNTCQPESTYRLLERLRSECDRILYLNRDDFQLEQLTQLYKIHDSISVLMFNITPHGEIPDINTLKTLVKSFLTEVESMDDSELRVSLTIMSTIVDELK